MLERAELLITPRVGPGHDWPCPSPELGPVGERSPAVPGAAQGNRPRRAEPRRQQDPLPPLRGRAAAARTPLAPAEREPAVRTPGQPHHPDAAAAAGLLQQQPGEGALHPGTHATRPTLSPGKPAQGPETGNALEEHWRAAGLPHLENTHRELNSFLILNPE